MGKVISVGPYSAYGIAVKQGYEGTEEEWIHQGEQKGRFEHRCYPGFAF